MLLPLLRLIGGPVCIRFRAQVDELGDTKRTVVCISSDHGEMLGDHGVWQKSKPWEGAPLSVLAPNRLAGGPLLTTTLHCHVQKGCFYTDGVNVGLSANWSCLHTL